MAIAHVLCASCFDYIAVLYNCIYFKTSCFAEPDHSG